HHRIDGVLELQNFAARVDRDFGREIASRHGRGYTGDVTHLVGEVTGHPVHRIGEILPHTADVLHDGLAAELSFRSDLTRHARHFRCERVELVHHGVDSVLELENFALRVDGDFRREVALGDGRGHTG